MTSYYRTPGKNYLLWFLSLGFTLLAGSDLFAAAEISTSAPMAVPNMAGSVVRVFGALALVMGLLFGGVWLMRNWQRINLRKGRAIPNLNILEVRSLGPRQTLFVVGYNRQRLLVAASPAGIQLLTPLPEADEDEVKQTSPTIHFADALQQVLSRGAK
ncbi:MAG: flagellar assembly protein FliO [Verrucomicrobiales bacterium]|nr:flagellar assembly protein FliO [Verrucomicrobiales bacterium]